MKTHGFCGIRVSSTVHPNTLDIVPEAMMLVGIQAVFDRLARGTSGSTIFGLFSIPFT